MKLPLLAAGRCATNAGGFLLAGTECAGQGDFLGFSLPCTLKGGKGGCTMTFEQVVLLLSLLGGAIFVTFQITWTVSHSNDKDKKNDRLTLYICAVIFS